MTLLQNPEFQRAGFLLVPLLSAAVLVLTVKPTPRQATAALVAFLWQIPAVFVLHLIATAFGWWRFEADTHIHLGLPIDVWIGWALWWGPVAVFAQRIAGTTLVVIGMVLIDLIAMPLAAPLIVLAPHWHIGEPVALAICLLPALHFARLTEEDRAPLTRTRYHAVGWGGYLLLVLPSLALAYEGRTPLALFAWPQWTDMPFFAVLGFNLLFGLAAALEFARAGHGTPIPFDPPKRVVTTGPYAFCANPMQVTSFLVMLLIAIHVRSWAVFYVAAVFLIFDSIYARWYNQTHISLAMPADWTSYRANVHEFRLRWRPYVPQPATLYVPDESWPSKLFAAVARHLAPINLAVVLGSGLETKTRVRLRYEMPGAGLSATGWAALWRAFEHTNLLVVCVGWLIGLPLFLAALEWLGAKLPLRLILARREAARV